MPIYGVCCIYLSLLHKNVQREDADWRGSLRSDQQQSHKNKQINLDIYGDTFDRGCSWINFVGWVQLVQISHVKSSRSLRLPSPFLMGSHFWIHHRCIIVSSSCCIGNFAGIHSIDYSSTTKKSTNDCFAFLFSIVCFWGGLLCSQLKLIVQNRINRKCCHFYSVVSLKLRFPEIVLSGNQANLC